jgi:ABC-type maltose transport system permease subunit
MMAAAVITLVPIFAMFVYFQRYIVGGLTLGAVKG